MNFGKSLFAKKLLSLFVLITLICPLIKPPVAGAFSFFGFGSSEEETLPVKIETKKNNVIKQDKIIAVLVQSELVQDTVFATAIDRYAKDGALEIGARSIVIPIPKGASVKEIYEGLAHLYFMGDGDDGKSQLVGTVLIGEIPIPVVEKASHLWPTIFPYTDFEERVYLWDNGKDRFVFHEGSNMEPEIWHGVIRSQKDNLKSQSDEILKFLDENHKVHAGETTFEDNLFYANTANQKSLPGFLEDKYNRWLNYAEDITYKRFNKPLLESLEKNADEQNTTEVITGIPDLHTKIIISQLADNYWGSNKFRDKVTVNKIARAGDWEDTFDTTMKLLSKKDLESFSLLKEVNDLIETVIIKQVETNNIAGNISVSHTVEVIDPITLSTETKPIYVNGVLASKLTAKDCTLYRGIAPDENHPYAQKVEGNRTLNKETIDSCASQSDAESERYADKYEGCCAKNMEDNDASPTYSYCDTGSEWHYGRIASDKWDHQGAELPVFDITGTQLGEGPDGAFGCNDLLVNNNESSLAIHKFDSLVLHREPTQETIEKQQESGLSYSLPVDDPRGFSFYDYQNNFYRIDFLNIFDLRGKISSADQLQENIKKQLETKVSELNRITEASSVKSDRLYNQYKEIKWPGKQFILPPNTVGGCDYLVLPEQIDKFNKKITWTESCSYGSDTGNQEVTTAPRQTEENQIIKLYEFGVPIPDSIVAGILGEIDFERLYSSFDWLGRTLNEKNQIVLEYALGEVSDFPSFLDYNFNGYELAHLSTAISDGSTLPVGFNLLTNDFDKDFFAKKAQNILSNIDSDKYEKDFSSDVLVQNHRVNLLNKYITSSLPRIFISKDDLKPIRVTFSIKDKYGKIDEKNYKTEVALNFSSSEVDQFFEVFPAKRLKVTAGKASFFLKPKKQSFGGKLTVKAYVPKTKLSTEEIPIMITRYDTLVKTSKHDMTVNDSEGSLLTVYVYNSDGKITKNFEGKSLKFISENGTFQGGIDTAQIQNGKAEIRFFPGRKSGVANVTVIDEELKLPDSEIKINILPGEPRYINFEKNSKVLIATSNYQDVFVQLTDRYNNKISRASHELSWKIEKGEIEKQEERDGNPREKGVQEWINIGKSSLGIRPTNKNQSKVRLTISSSILPKNTGISREFTVIPNPQLNVISTKKSISVGSEKPVRIKLKAQTEKGEVVDYDFKVNVSVVPADFPHYENEVVMESGRGDFEFYPGTKAGKYTVVFSAEGFENRSVDIEVLPGQGRKLQMTTTKKIWDKDDLKIPVDILMLDGFGNRVNSNEKISLSVSEMTEGLLSVPASELFLRNGKVTVGLKPQGESGDAHLTVEGNNVIGDSLKLSIEELLSVDEISEKFDPKVKFMILSGPVGGNIFLEKNIGTALLFAGKTQAVSTMGAEYEESALGYGFVSQIGELSALLSAKFVFEQNTPELLIISDDKVVAKVRMIYANDPKIYLGKVSNSYGIYINSKQKGLKLSGHNLLFEDERLLSFTKKGGINLISGGVVLEMVENSLTKLNLKKDNEILGTITYNLPHEIFAKDEYFKDDFQGLWLKSVNNDTNFKSIFTGNSTEGEKGFSIINKSETSSMGEKLGSSKSSIEDTQIEPDKVWESLNWNPATLFVGGNSIGVSTQRGGSDLGLLLGDPTLSREKFTPIKDDKTMGISLWKSSDGDIKDLSSSDINEDGNLDLVLQVNNQILGLYQTADKVGDFTEEIILSEASDGIKSMGSLSSNTGNVTSKNGVAGFVQINSNGDFILHENQDGSITKKKLPFGQKFEKIETANLNGDQYTDVVGIDKNQKLWRIFGEKDGFGKPKLLEDLSPEFNTVDETDTDLNAEYLSQIEINYTTSQKEKELKTLSESVFSSNLKIKSDGEKLKIGDKLFGSLSITTPVGLEKFSVTIPAYKNIEFEISSLKCTACPTVPSAGKDQQTGGIIVGGLVLDAESKLTLTWQFKVKSISTAEFFVGDFENGKDDLDDISVPWNFGGRVGTLEFLSSKQQTRNKKQLVASLTEVGGVLSTIKMGKLSSNSSRLFAQNSLPTLTPEDPVDILPSSSIDQLKETGEDQIENILTKNTSYPSLSSLFDNMSTSLTEPSDDFMSMAAGSDMDQEMSIKVENDTMLIPSPGQMSMGKPIINNPLTYRFYIVPTTTGKIGIATCLDKKIDHMKSPSWAPYTPGAMPNCRVIIMGGSYGSGTGTTTSIKTTSNGSFSLTQEYSENKNLFGVDIVTQWLKDQWRELTYNFHRVLPRVSFHPPDLTKSPSNDDFNTDINKYDQLQQELLKSKFINIQKIPLIISIPDLDRLSDTISVDVSVDADLSAIDNDRDRDEVERQIAEYEEEQKKQLEEQLKAKVEEFVKDYDELKEELLLLREKNIELLEEALTLSDDLTHYFESWISKNNEIIDEWKLSAIALGELSQSLKQITIDFFLEFQQKYTTAAIDRGTWLPWLYTTLSQTTYLPVAKLTPDPDITLNTAEVVFGADVKIADVELKKIDVDLHELVDLSIDIDLADSAIQSSPSGVNINFPQANLPNINFPELPKIIIPETDVFAGLFKDLDKKLKILPSSPDIPPKTSTGKDIVSFITDTMINPHKFETLFGQLRQGQAMVPEWGLKAYIEQLTNEILLDSFFEEKLNPPKVQSLIPDKKIIEENYEREQIDFFEFLDEFSAQNKNFDRTVLHNKFEKDNREIANLHKNLVHENKILKQLINKPAKEFFAHKEIENIFMKDDRYFTSNDVSTSTELQESNLENVTNQDYINSIEGESKEDVHTLIKDIDDDGSEEIFYTNGPELFVKYNKARTHGNVGSENVKKWNYDLFKSKKEVASDIKVNNKSLVFTPFDKNISYYELFFSDRPDGLFELTSFPSERKSKKWKRYGLAKQNLFKNYKISKVPASVTKIKGSPKIKIVKPVELMTYSEEKCNNPEVKKSFFSSRAILMAKEDDTRLSIRVPALQFKPAEYQIIRLKKGESTSIDYGKVCVFSGKLESVDLSKDQEVFDIKLGQMITSDMELIMNNGDFVKFETSGDSLVSVYDKDEYQLSFFSSNEETIGYMLEKESLSQNLYGFLIGFIDEQRTLVRRKIFFNAID